MLHTFKALKGIFKGWLQSDLPLHNNTKGG